MRFSATFAVAVLLVSITNVPWHHANAAAGTQDDHTNDQGYRVPLFDGTDLDHFTVRGSEVEIEEGTLKLVSGDGFIHTNAQYDDFVLELEWKALKEEAYDSGIYFRAALPEGERPWPRSFQINLKQNDECNLIGNKDARSTGLIRIGDWNRIKLTVFGQSATMEINGKEAWHVENVEDRIGFIGIQSEVPLGGQFQFRNIFVTEIHHESLFDGKEISRWEPANENNSECWDVHEGHLRCTGQRGTWLRSVDMYADFNLRLEYLLMPGGNSGVYVRVPTDGNHHGENAGIEVQILDDNHQRYTDLKDYQFSGSLYAVSPATSRPGRSPGAWNELEIDCNGHSYRVVLNGVEIISTDKSATPQLEERLLEGYLGLQNHNEEVLFRHLRIGPSQQ